MKHLRLVAVAMLLAASTSGTVAYAHGHARAHLGVYFGGPWIWPGYYYPPAYAPGYYVYPPAAPVVTAPIRYMFLRPMRSER